VVDATMRNGDLGLERLAELKAPMTARVAVAAQDDDGNGAVN